MSAVAQPTPDTKWFQKEVRTVVFRNLSTQCSAQLGERTNERGLTSFRLEILAATCGGEGPVLFSGSSVSSSNPSWAVDGMLLPEDSTQDPLHPELIFKIHEDVDGAEQSRGDSRSVLFEVHVTRLVSLGQTQLRGIECFPVNSILLATDNGYYVSDVLYKSLTSSGLVVLTGRMVVDDESAVEALDVQAMRGEMADSIRAIGQLRVEATAALEAGEQRRQLVLRNGRKTALEQLRREVLAAESRVSGLLSLEGQERHLLGDTGSLRGAAGKIQQLTDDVAALRAAATQEEGALSQTLFLSEVRQAKAVLGLQRTYPVQLLESGDYSIRGAELPVDCSSSNNQRDDEQVSTALGYVAHALLLTSKYLNISLRYRLILCGSRSAIEDPILPSLGPAQGPLALPLYKKGVERERFDRALLWLKRDIQQILLVRGEEYESKKNILFNVNKIFTSYASSEKIAF